MNDFTLAPFSKVEKNFNIENLKIDINIWIVQKLNDFIPSVTNNIKKFRFNDAVRDIYYFTKNIFCDWYIECIKVFFNEGNDKDLIREVKNCSTFCFIELLKVCHPFIPFISDEIYYNIMNNDKYLDQIKWPEKITLKQNSIALRNTEYSMGLISKLRNIKSSLKIEPKVILTLFVNKDLKYKSLDKNNEKLINSLARIKIDFSNFNKKNKQKYIKFLYKNVPFNLNYSDDDISSDSDIKDLSYLKKELKHLETEIQRIEVKLKNKNFIEKAPAKVVEQNRKKLNKFFQNKNKLSDEISLLNKKEIK